MLLATKSISTNTPSMQINIYMTEVTIEAMRMFVKINGGCRELKSSDEGQ